MSQKRYFNFGSPSSAKSLKEVFSGLTSKGVLQGGGLTVSAPNILVIQPIWVVFPSGLILFESEIKNLTIPVSSTNLNFTITYRHTDGEIIGGNAATLAVESGLLSNDNPLLANGLAVAYIQYTGTGPLIQSQVIAAPQNTLHASSTPGDGDFRFPPFGEGFLQLSQVPASPVVTVETTDTAVPATFGYRDPTDVGGVTITAVVSGVSGNNIKFRFFSNGLPGQPLVFNPPPSPTTTTFDIQLATDGGSAIISTMDDIFALLNSNGNFLTKASPGISPTGVGSTVATSFPSAFADPAVYQNLIGGIAGFGFANRYDNTANSVNITHNLKWVFLARSAAPKAVLIEFAQGGGSTLSIQVIDTLGNLCTLATPVDLVESSGLTRRTIRIINGTFNPGQQFYCQATVLTKAFESSSISLLGASSYQLPF